MKSQATARIASLAAMLAAAGSASAHITYTGRNFGSFSPGNQSTATTLGGSVSSNFGWAYSTDPQMGDSHRLRAFRFNLATAGNITVSTGAGAAGFFPAFSVYGGLSHLAPHANAHDTSTITTDELNFVYGSGHGKRGAFNALADWFIGNDANANQPASLRHFDYMGHAADGTSANFGSNPGIIGDGLADGVVTATFNLPAGDYTLMVGGAHYTAAPPAGPYNSNAVNVTLSVIPEPSTALLGALGALALLRRRR